MSLDLPEGARTGERQNTSVAKPAEQGGTCAETEATFHKHMEPKAADARVAELQKRIKVAVEEEDYIKAAALKEQLQAAMSAASAAFERAHVETLNNLKQCEGELQAAKELVAAAKDLVENRKATLAERVAALKVARSEMKAAVDAENYTAAAKLKKARDEAEAEERDAREASVLAQKELAEAQKGERELLSRHNGLNKLLSAAGEPSREKATKGFSFKSRAKKPAATGYARISASGYTRLTDEADDGSVNVAAPVDADDGSFRRAAAEGSARPPSRCSRWRTFASPSSRWLALTSWSRPSVCFRERHRCGTSCLSVARAAGLLARPGGGGARHGSRSAEQGRPRARGCTVGWVKDAREGLLPRARAHPRCDALVR